MAETINMPKLGFDMAEGVLVRWVKQTGENINKGDVLAEIETDKATVEVESSASGVILQLIVDQGDVVPVNAPIAVVGAEGEKVDVPAATTDSGPKTEEKPTDAKPAAPTQPASAPAQQTSSSLEGDRIKASLLPKRSHRKRTSISPICRAPAPADVLLRKMLKQLWKVEHRRVDRSHNPPIKLMSHKKIRPSKPPSSARLLADVWLNRRQPSRTST
jgi:pyruvate dehydrogenase E2 component (dihydrolipoamide acetyltransferase)